MATDPISRQSEEHYLCGHCGLKERRPSGVDLTCSHCGSSIHLAEQFAHTAGISGTFYSGADRFWLGYSFAMASVLCGGASVFFSLFGFWYPVLNLPIAFVGILSGVLSWILCLVDLRSFRRQSKLDSLSGSGMCESIRKDLEKRVTGTRKLATWGFVVSLTVFAIWVLIIIRRLFG